MTTKHKTRKCYQRYSYVKSTISSLNNPPPPPPLVHPSRDPSVPKAQQGQEGDIMMSLPPLPEGTKQPGAQGNPSSPPPPLTV